VILVTGATGRIGSALVPDLLARGAPVRALVLARGDDDEGGDPEDGVLDEQVDVVEGDLDRPETLGPAFDGVDSVLMLVPGSPLLVAREANVMEAAGRAGVAHVVQISGLGAGPDSPFSLTRWHGESELRLARSGLGYTILRPNFFMQNLLFLFPTLFREGTIYGAMGTGMVSMVDYRDVAAVAAAVLSEPGRHLSLTYLVTGPEALSFQDVASRISTSTGCPVRYIDLPPDQARLQLLRQGTKEPFADALLELFRSFSEGQASQVTDVVATVAGRTPRTLDDFIHQFGDDLLARRPDR